MMEDFNSETDSDYTSYWRDWVRAILGNFGGNHMPRRRVLRSKASHVMLPCIFMRDRHTAEISNKGPGALKVSVPIIGPMCCLDRPALIFYLKRLLVGVDGLC